MKLFKFSSIEFNPFYRDLIIVVAAGLLASLAIITTGYMIVSQF